jgi:3-methyladenine DNA glycosylase/8-oxoguanine DNA glycosylase
VVIICELPLRGAGGEPISFARTVYSHGCAQLPPALVQENPLAYRRAFRVKSRVVDVEIREQKGMLAARSPQRMSGRDAQTIESTIVRMFRLRDDLSRFYALIAEDPSLAWAARGAGRILASPSVFEDVIKTICTTNCAWSATERMTRALAQLGGGAFPEPAELAATPEQWYREVAKMGYRGAYVKAIALDVSEGVLDLESLVLDSVADADVEERLLALPGIGPYGAAHVMQLLGRHRSLVLDSWTRPKYRRIIGKRRAADSTIRRHFARYGAYAGLAFWLTLTRDWLDDERAL